MAASNETLVCVKQVKQEVTDEWDESMPLPGDIIEGFSEHSADDFFMPVKTRSKLSSQLSKISPKVEFIWIKVRRSNSLLKLQDRVVQLKGSILHRKYTIQAATDHRHIVDLEDLTLQQCTELQVLRKSSRSADATTKARNEAEIRRLEEEMKKHCGGIGPTAITYPS